MTTEDKKLLLSDLCARLPYGVKTYVRHYSKLDRKWYEGTYTVNSVHPSLNEILVSSDKYSVEVLLGHFDYEIKPYLFPLTEEILYKATNESNEFYGKIISLDWNSDEETCNLNIPKRLLLRSKIYSSVVNYFYKHHIDYNGLIEKDLALDATGLGIY